MFSASAISSNTTTTGSFNIFTILFIMLLLSGVAAAFRSSTASVSASVAASTSASRRSASTTTDRAGGDGRRREEVPLRSTSLASDAVQAATDVIERSHRRYWTELAHPFGIRGLRKLRKRERRVHTRNEQSSSASIRSRSVVTGSLLKGVDEGDAGADNHGAASISSDYTWDEHGESERGDDDTEKTLTHLCFLVHGHRGQSKDLSYMHAAIQGRSSEVRRQRREELRRLESSRSSGDDADNEIAAAIDQIRASLGQNVLVHSATCNEGKTNDGVRAGGERLVEEMLQVIRKEADRTRRKNQSCNLGGDDVSEVVDITLSLVGNSLGGIYSRYAIALLFEMAEEVDENDVDCSSKTFLLDTGSGSIRLRFETFCTTATPHLGCSRHTYVSLPRSAETVVGNFLGETGRDLFRMNDLLYSMGTVPYFLQPLSQFRRRVAYANAYHTDFPVPAATAAFLHEESSHAHFWDASSGNSEWDKSIVAILHTQSSYSPSLSKDCKDDLFGDCDDELLAMSKSLDSLGWKKVIVDLRNEIPAAGIPNVVRKSSLVMKVKQKNGSYQYDGNTEDFEENLVPVQNGTLSDSEVLRTSLRRKGVIASRDVREAFGSPRDGSLHLPVGHNMICAFSRGRVSSHMNRGGRPVMDALAKELVDEIFGAKNGSTV